MDLSLSVFKNVKISRTDLVILLLIIIFASFIRIWDLGNVGFNNDEAVYSGQAATLAGYEEYSKYFSIHRAHPLLFQFSVSILYILFGVSDTLARIISVIFGVMTVIITYFIGRILYTRREVGFFAALLLALLPYHIIVTRQAMVDVPFSFFFSLTIFFMAIYIKSNSGNQKWLLAVGASAGLSFLSKEVGFLTLIASIVSLLLLNKRIQNLKRNLAMLISAFLVTISPHLALIIVGSKSTQSKFLYFAWQLNRPPNQPVDFYVDILGIALGYVLLVLVVAAIIHSLKTRNPSGFLLLIFITIPLIFFQVWPTKGFHYLIVLVPPLVIFGVSFLFSDWFKKLPRYKIISLILIPLIILSTNQVIGYIYPSKDQKFLAGSGGLPNVREAALWLKENSDQNSTIMAIGPTMGNIIKFYANRDTLSLNINPTKILRNPAYDPITDPEFLIETNKIEYLVYDKYSERRSQQTADRLYYFVNKYALKEIYAEYEIHRTANGGIITEPVIVIYHNKK